MTVRMRSQYDTHRMLDEQAQRNLRDTSARVRLHYKPPPRPSRNWFVRLLRWIWGRS